MSAPLRVVAIADADSFVKWSASLLSGVDGIRRHLLIVRTPLTVSREQEGTALAGTAFTDADITRVSFDEVRGWLTGHEPDVVVLAARGPLVRLLGTQIDRLAKRPVVVSGLPGMSIPAQRGALDYRRHTDLMVLHSHREQRAFAELGERIGVDVPTSLATLPFAAGERERPVAAVASVPSAAQRGSTSRWFGGGTAVAERATEPVARLHPPATDLVFAAQALVPGERAERLEIAEMLIAAAEAEPRKRVVIKLRSRPGENETHLERDAYAGLLRTRPTNLVFSYRPMRVALAQAEGLVTVSSTAAIEALALGVPVIALDAFGVHKTLLNTVFVGSGLLGGAEEVIARRFRHPVADWQRDNYFHPASESTWWRDVEELVVRRRTGILPERRMPAPRGGALHAAWHRKSVLGSEDRSVSGAIALAIGAPVVRTIVSRRRLGSATWADASTDYTLEPTPHDDPIRR